MCGIAGFIDFKRQCTEDILSRMTTAVKHRGPDGHGASIIQTDAAVIGLGHRRLSIIDLSEGGKQPMQFRGLHLVFNGEIYNYQEVKDMLIAVGDTFESHSDTEVILHAWARWGSKSIDMWRGMFAIAIYDERTNKVFCIRDRVGIKPLFYSWNGNTFLFASELKSLTANPYFTKQIDPDAVSLYLQYGNVPSPYCIYKDTFKLPAGHLLTLDLNTRAVNLNRYWDLYDYYNRPKLKIDFQEAITETERLLKESFDLRMVADVPVGVFLSGGYDSTCVAALLQKDRTDKIKTFTIGSDQQELNEADFARDIARIIGTDHTEQYCTFDQALNIIPTLPYYFDEPFGDSSAIPTILVSQLARKQVTVALSADAGDEIFAGYRKYDYVFNYNRILAATPTSLIRGVGRLMATTPVHALSRNIKLLNDLRYEKLKENFLNPSTDAFVTSINQLLSNKDVASFMDVTPPSINSLHCGGGIKSEYYDLLSSILAIDYQTYLIDDVLQKVDRATMSVGLEGREPFLDRKIIEWVAQLPSSYKMQKRKKKILLKEIVHQYLPKELMDRPKKGFVMPVKSWLFTELKEMVLHNLSPDQLKQHGLFNQAKVDKTVKAFYNGKMELNSIIWYLLMFQMWYSTWFSEQNDNYSLTP